MSFARRPREFVGDWPSVATIAWGNNHVGRVSLTIYVRVSKVGAAEEPFTQRLGDHVVDLALQEAESRKRQSKLLADIRRRFALPASAPDSVELRCEDRR